MTYALEGSIFVAGAAIQWLRDELRFLESAGDSEYMARKVADTNGCYIVPAFTGLGAPHWDAYARGTMVGLTRGVNKYHIVRATLDSIAYQTADVLNAMEADAGMQLSKLKVDGGASANNYLLQSQADINRSIVVRPRCVETTAMGAAYLAGLGVGYWKDLEDIRKNWAVDRFFDPVISAEETAAKVKGWKKRLPAQNSGQKNKNKRCGKIHTSFSFKYAYTRTSHRQCRFPHRTGRLQQVSTGDLHPGWGSKYHILRLYALW